MDYLVITTIHLLGYAFLSQKKVDISLRLTLLLSSILHLLYIYIARDITNFDLQSYNIIGLTVLGGNSIYPSPGNLHHPYLPFMLYTEAFAVFVGKNLLTYEVILKLLFSLSNLAIIPIIYKVSNKNSYKALLYGLNPVTIQIVALHGQFDTIPLFFILLSFYLSARNPIASQLSFSMAILVKSWPVILLASIYQVSKKKVNILLISTLPVIAVGLYSIVYRTNPIEILSTVSGYMGITNNFGLSLFTKNFLKIDISQYSIIATLTTFGYSFYMMKRQHNIYKLALSTLLFFIVFSIGFGIQWLSWIIPFLVITYGRKYFWISIVITAYLALFYYGWFNPDYESSQVYFPLASHILWLILIWLFLKVSYVGRNTTPIKKHS